MTDFVTPEKPELDKQNYTHFRPKKALARRIAHSAKKSEKCMSERFQQPKCSKNGRGNKKTDNSVDFSK